jgi:tetratricopeptide (TPR) repeat protein
MTTKDTDKTRMPDSASYQTMQAESDPEKLFKLGLQCLKRNLPLKAHMAFTRAYKLRPEEQRYCSYYGLTIAMVHRNLEPALKLCSEAMEKNYMYPDLYRNLGRVYLLAGQREKAYGVFKEGLKLDAASRDLHAELATMGIRKPPVFPFLDRNHPLNFIAGKLRHWLICKKPGVEPHGKKMKR